MALALINKTLFCGLMRNFSTANKFSPLDKQKGIFVTRLNSRLVKFAAVVLSSLLIISHSAFAGSGCRDILEHNVFADKIDEALEFLEEVEGDEAIEWVETQNAVITQRLETDPRFAAIKQNILDDLNSQDKLVIPSIEGDEVINFWRDAKNPKGIWRVATLESYNKGNPQWKTVIDFDALAKKENENWVFKGTTRLPNSSRMIVSLSRDGKDAVVLREFDRATGEFVQDGFFIEEGVGNTITWVTEDDVLVTSSLEGGDVTNSGYPLTVRRMKRGQKLSEAQEIFRGVKKDIGVWPGVYRDSKTKEVTDIIIHQSYNFNDGHIHYVNQDGSQTLISKPKNSNLGFVGDEAFLSLEEEVTLDGTTYAAGSILQASKKDVLAGNPKYEVVFEPNSIQAVSQSFVLDDRILLVLAENVSEKLIELKKENGVYVQRTVVDYGLANISLVNTSRQDGRVRFTVSTFLEPTRYYEYDYKTRTHRFLDSEPDAIDSSQYEAQQFFATSEDGTPVPYYMISKRGMKLDGSNPALVYAYGGFQISLKPYYHDAQVKNWIDKGGVYVIANARGGGEYGPNWWRQALQENRNKSYEDVEAVAQDLVTKGVSSPGLMGAMGGSNGGLMAGNMLTRNSGLWGAVISMVPLLDMLRFHKLLRGASWQDEYGFPDNKKHVPHLKRISAFHNVDPSKNFIEALFMTSTADDRVHPGHARKMARKLALFGFPVLFYENREGGHGGASNYDQVAHGAALRYVYLMQKLMD